ncbi:MAG: DUF3015 domain-containing protein [Gammaproteobacteria bacterium]|nr:DUF3015 domain-containing protein [Gammaproteobacteria bacterium]
MKRIAVSVLLLGFSASSYAVAPGGPDCGWGNLLFEGQSGIGSHFVASITNGSTGNATFGMTSGTNGCSTNGTLTYGGNSSLMSAIMDEFSEDVARGNGEALTAVAVAIGIAPEDRAEFDSVMHQNFDTLFPSQDVTAQQVELTMFELMQQDKRLAQYVS